MQRKEAWNGIVTVEPEGPGTDNSRSSQQFIHEASQRPEVHGFVVTFVEDDLRSHVLRGATEGPGLAAGVKLLGETKIYKLHISVNS